MLQTKFLIKNVKIVKLQRTAPLKKLKPAVKFLTYSQFFLSKFKLAVKLRTEAKKPEVFTPLAPSLLIRYCLPFLSVSLKPQHEAYESGAMNNSSYSKFPPT